MSKKQTLALLAKLLQNFADERDWNQFHSPKNLAIALSVEVSELLEEFQWLTEEQSRHLVPERLQKVREEIGDVMIYLIQLSDRLGLDPLSAAFEKLEKNRAKYPVEKAKGTNLKYTDF